MKGLVAKVYFSVLSDRKSRRYFFMDFCMEIYLLMQDAIALPIFLDLMLKAYDDGRKDVMYKYLVIWIFMGVLFLFLRYWFDLFVNGKFYYLTVDNIRETCLKSIYKFKTQNIDQNYNGNELYVFLDQDLTRLINSLFRFNRILADAIIIVCFLIWSLSVGGWLAVIVVIGATIGPFIATKESKKIDKYNEEVYQKKSIYAGGLRGLFSGTEAYLGKGIYRESSVKCISDIGEFIQSTLTLSKQRAHKINMVSAVDGLVYLSLVVLSYFFIDIENSSSIIVLISVYSTMKTYISGLGGNISYIFENQYVAKKYEEISSTQIVKDERTTTTNIFEMKNVSYKVDNHDILQNIDFVMKTNSKVALIGKNGSGKTTLLKILLSLIVPSEGSVVISDKEKYGYVPVHSQLFPVSIEENIDYGNENEKFDKMDQLVESVELSCLGKDRLTEELHDGEENLSGGEAQRVSIARALAAESSVLVLDEPTANLDVLTSHKVFDTLVHSVTNILFTTHNPELLQYADQIYILDKGRIVTSGTYDEIRKSIIYREWECEVQGK